MTKMSDFTMEELMLFIIGVTGALGGLMLTLQNSKCKSICWGMCIRDIDAVVQTEKINMTGHTGETPRKQSAGSADPAPRPPPLIPDREPDVENN